MAPVVEGEFVNAAGAQRLDRRKELALAGEVGERGAEDAPDLALAAQPPGDVEEVRLHPLGTRLVEAGFDDAGGGGEGGEIAAFVPGAAGGAGDRGDDGDCRIRADSAADLADQRGDDAAAETEIAPQVAVRLHVREPEGFGHVGG